jgi:hypothetical protein
MYTDIILRDKCVWSLPSARLTSETQQNFNNVQRVTLLLPVTHACQAKKKILSTLFLTVVSKHIILTAAYETKRRKPRLIANQKSGERCTAYHHAEQS